MRPKIPPQIVRIILLTIAIVASYLAARHVLTPASFGQYGHYRGDALEEIASAEPHWAGKKACIECHSDHVAKLAKGEHKDLACEGCHGPARAHADNPDLKLEKPAFGACVHCHEANPARPAWMHQINSKKHYTGQKCTECHMPHQPNEVP
jgi:hypothetical protein